jgi:4-carboxymuconolactone decarboxylase
VTGGTPRISPLTEQELSQDARELLALPLKGHRESAISPFLLTVVRHPGLYRRYAPFVGKLLVGGKLPARDRELAILRGAWLCRCSYEWGEHVRLAGAAGITGTEIEAIVKGSHEPSWSPADRAVLSATEQLHATGHISDDTWNSLVLRYDEMQLIELPMLIGAYQMIAYAQNALRTSLPEGSVGLEAR